MKNNIIILFLVLSQTAFPADSLSLILPVKAAFFTTDRQLNIYYINEKQEIIKYNHEDSAQISYSNKTLGSPSFIDAGNPMKILAFYPDYFTIVILDNHLAELSVIQLNSISSSIQYQPLAICRDFESDDIWMYDALSRKLIRFNEKGAVMAESEPADQLLDITFEDPQLFSAHNRVGIIDSHSDLYFFDRYGNFVSIFNIKTQFPLQFNGDHLIITDGISISEVDLATYEQSAFARLPVGIRQCNLQQGHTFILTDTGIASYFRSVKEPQDR